MKNCRINLLFGFLTFLAFIIFIRLFQFQIIENNYWRALAHGQQRTFLQIQGERGEIFITDRNNHRFPLAINRSWEMVYLSPGDIWRKGGNPEEIATTLANILKIDKNLILKRINRQNSLYEVIKTRLSPQEVVAIKEANLLGVHIKNEIIRYYPQNELASHIVGFVGGQGLGQYGIENYYNDILQGNKRIHEVERIARGIIGRAFGFSDDRGEDVILTIDYNIQFMAERLLLEAKKELNIEGGTILVANPHTGRILALANFPNFNPNEFQKETDLKIFKNSATQTIFEPGSIFKSITLAIALEEEKITPETIYNDKGFIQIGGHIIRNFARRTWGKVTMSDILDKSINTGSVHAQRLIGNDRFMDYMKKFGFFEPTGINLQGEVYSENLSFRRGYEINFANASFGQGIEMTSMQIIRAFSALANGGNLINPYITQKKESTSDEKRIISPKTSSQITSMMVSVTENGFAKTARIPGYYVAGKTGTAQVSWASLGIPKRGYSDKTIQGFVGYAPAFDPTFIMLVKLHNPQARTAEYSAAPIFAELGKYILNYYQIPPER